MDRKRHNPMFGETKNFNTPTKPGSSLFLGDPVVIPSEVAGEMVTATTPAKAAETAVQAVAESRGQAAADQYAEMGPYDKMSITQFPILAVNNGTLSQTPIDRPLNAGNVNYNVQLLMNQYPIPGLVKTVFAAAGGVATITLAAADAAAMGVTAFVIPFVLIVIAASTIDAAPGSPITVSVTGETSTGEDVASDDWTIERTEVTKPVTILLVPYRVIANRPLPANGFVDADTSFVITLSGLKETESVTAKVMGYAMNELSEVGKRMGLPSAIIR